MSTRHMHLKNDNMQSMHKICTKYQVVYRNNKDTYQCPVYKCKRHGNINRPSLIISSNLGRTSSRRECANSQLLPNRHLPVSAMFLHHSVLPIHSVEKMRFESTSDFAFWPTSVLQRAVSKSGSTQRSMPREIHSGIQRTP